MQIIYVSSLDHQERGNIRSYQKEYILIQEETIKVQLYGV
jgi:hypothetical protein